MSKTTWMAAGALAFLSVSGAIASEAKTYEIIGQVLELQPDRVVMDSAGQKLEFRRDASVELPKNIHVGDRIAIFYSLDARKVKTVPKQQAGEAVPRPSPIVDDRAFYPA